MGGGKDLSRIEDFYDLNSVRLAEGKVKFSLPLTWSEDGQIRSRTLSIIVNPDKLKP